MELFERRRYYFCRYCGTFHFLETTETDGVRTLETPAHALACPVCAGKLATAVLDQAHSVKYCGGCRGVLVPRPHFAEVVQMRRAWAAGQPIPPLPLDRRELERALTCPSCSAKMATHPYHGPGNVVIDTCDACNIVWLDFGELKQIADAPGHDRGVKTMPRADLSELVAPARRVGLDVIDTPGPLGFLLHLLSFTDLN